MLKTVLNFIFLSLLLLLSSCADEPIFQRLSTLYKVGDQPDWAAKNWDDSDWNSRLDLAPESQIFWTRTTIKLLESPEKLRPYGIQQEVYGEYEVFWDGVLIGKNGNPGQETELPPEGEIWVTYRIPTELSEVGDHVLAIRTSLLHFPDHTKIFEMEIDYYDELLTDRLIETSYMHVFAGAFLIISFYFLFLFLTNKKEYTTLIFSVCCSIIFALVVTLFSTDYLPIHYSFHVVRLQILSSFLLSISFLIPLYFSMQFPFPRQKLVLMIYAGVLILIFLFDHHAFDFRAVGMVLSMWCFSFGVVAYGAYKKVSGARIVLITLMLSMGIFLTFGFVISLYAGLGLILLGMLYLVALRIKDQRVAYENSLVQSTRLQLELLKKNIQPHFLMNTLTSLIDWVEESPNKGVLFIEALAKEFDLVNQMGSKTLLPITKEIELCKAHIEVMEYRKEISYIWEEEGIDPEQKIPPGILHTLLENGITHSLPLGDNTIKFMLTYGTTNDFRRYTFMTFAKGSRKKEPVEGTGIKYVKARLEESYHDQWDFISKATNDGWKNEIKIYTKGK